jgi:hypothetical protein
MGMILVDRDYDGQPVNTSQQMDVDEYFNMLFDKLEKCLKGTQQERILQDCFGGKVVNQIICKETVRVGDQVQCAESLSHALIPLFLLSSPLLVSSPLLASSPSLLSSLSHVGESRIVCNAGLKRSMQVFGLDNPFKSEREEKFFTLQLEVKHKRNILESLDLFVEGEMLEGDNKYFCEEADQRVRVPFPAPCPRLLPALDFRICSICPIGQIASGRWTP